MTVDGYMIVFTTGEGGRFSAWPNVTPEMYDEVVRTGVMRWRGDRIADEPDYELRPKYVVLCRVERDHDFVTGGSRAVASAERTLA